MPASLIWTAFLVATASLVATLLGSVACGADAPELPASPPAASAPATPPAAVAGESRPYVPFAGPKSSWHGFDRFDFLMDEQTLAVAPLAAPAGQGNGIKGASPAGHRRCVVVAPRAPAAGNPWSWRACYWDHEPQTEIELLKRGFHVAYVWADADHRPDATWDGWYAYLTKEHGLSAKPAFVGMSRGGEFAYTWATLHPDQVSCIYADNPGGNPEMIARLGELAKRDVPLLHVCGSIDPLLGRVSNVIEAIYPALGGRISVMVKEGFGHHPHSLRDPTPIADFIALNANPPPASPVGVPDWVGAKAKRGYYYSSGSEFRELPSEKTFVTYRGPAFLGGYDRWTFELPRVEGAITVVAPKAPAAGKPWAFQADAVARDSLIDRALLAKGFHIVTGPVPYNADGPKREHWDAVYKHLIDHGFSARPVLKGNGAAAGEACAWALANPDKVSMACGVDPMFRSCMTGAPPLGDLAPLVKAGVRVSLAYGIGDADSREEAGKIFGLLRAAGEKTGLAGGTMEQQPLDVGGRHSRAVSDVEGYADRIAEEAVKPPARVAALATRPAGDNPPEPEPAPIPAAPPAAARPSPDYEFDGGVSRAVLENYLSRSISMEGLFNGRGDFKDNVRMLKETGAKFVGRSLCLWGNEAKLQANLDSAFWQVRVAQKADPDMVFQACVFETVSTQVEQVPVPAWAFQAFGRSPETRNFRYADMVYLDPKLRRDWGRNASVPDVSRPETQLWFYFLARSYIDLGFEAIHFGQVELMGRNDRDLAHWSRLLGLVRAHASTRARRHWVLCDGHVPSGGLLRDGSLLLDFHSFPLRIKEKPGEAKPDAAKAGGNAGANGAADDVGRPQEAELAIGFSDGLYGRSKGGVTPSGWACDHLPYLVELDNWGASKTPGEPGAGGIWVWGYDEITWFAHQPKDYRAQWLRYARDWVRKTDPTGFLQMPGSRTVRSPKDGMRWYHANRWSPAVPDGLGDEDAIREIWAGK